MFTATSRMILRIVGQAIVARVEVEVAAAATTFPAVPGNLLAAARAVGPPLIPSITTSSGPVRPDRVASAALSNASTYQPARDATSKSGRIKVMVPRRLS